MKSVLGIGNALVDIITKLDNEDLLKSFGLPKGSMTLVDMDTANYIQAETSGLTRQKASGGSAANAIHGLAHLGIPAGFIGKVGDDDLGRFFRKDMKVNKINPILFKSIHETGKALAMITPDSERTFATFLGAAVELSVEDLTSDVFYGYDYIFIEGYLVQNQPMLEKAVRLARNNNLKVCLDLASYNVVHDNREFFLKIMAEYVDIVFANEEEIKSLTGKAPEEAILEAGILVDIAVVKLGAEGSMVYSNGKLHRIGVRPTNPVDTTGAGDLYAAGFLYGLIMEQDLEICGKIGSILAGKVIEGIGAKMDEATWERLRREIKALIQ
ncbi:MAG: adenosine kinase [Bacteroidota bacterium]